MKKTALVLGLVLAAFGCSTPTEIKDPQQTIIVQAFLKAGTDPLVFLRQTLPPNAYYDGLEDTLRGADVQVQVDGQSFSLVEGPAGHYTLGRDQLPIEAGKTYVLDVEYQGRQLRGQTTVPFVSPIAEVGTEGADNTITYQQEFGDFFGQLEHPGFFRWTKGEGAAGYVIIIEATEVKSLPVWADPLTADLDSLIAQRQRLEGAVSADSLQALDRQIEQVRQLFSEGISLVNAAGNEIRWLRDRDQEDWDKIERKNWSEGRKWRERRQELFSGRRVEYWIPADTLRSDIWWVGVRFEGEYEVRLQTVDQNYFDYFTTLFNGQSGSDGDNGPIFNIEGGTGVFGSYSEAVFRFRAQRGDEGGPSLKLVWAEGGG